MEWLWLIVLCLYQDKSAIVIVPLVVSLSLTFCGFRKTCHFKGGSSLCDKDQSHPLLNDNALKNQLVFTTEETWSIKPNDWLLCLPLLIGWKAASCLYNSEGNG